MGQGFAHERLPEKGTVLLLDTYDLTEILKECQSYASVGYKIASSQHENLKTTLSNAASRINETLIDFNSSPCYVSSATDLLSQQLIDIESAFNNLSFAFKEDLENLRENLSKFSVTLFGRTMAGKSTLMEILTNGDGLSIGNGAQRTTRDVRQYNWNGLEITDVPGIGAFEGEDDEQIAFEAAKKADLILFLITDDAPQAAEAECFGRIMDLGKPVICIMNVKASAPEGKSIKLLTRDIEKRFDMERLNEIRKQFMSYSKQLGQDWGYVPFVYVHLKSAFMSQNTEDPQVKDTLHKVSRIGFLKKKIVEQVRERGCFYRVKTFIDIITNPMLVSMENLLNQSLLNSAQGRIVLSKKRQLAVWKDGFKATGKNRIRSLLINLKSQLNGEIAAFAEEHFDDKNADKAWNRLLQEKGIQDNCQTLLTELEETCNDKIKEVSREISQELLFSASFSGDRTLRMNRIIDGKKLWDWSATIIGGGLSISAIFAGAFGAAAAGPLGWIALGVSAVGVLGSLIMYCIDQYIELTTKAVIWLVEDLLGEARSKITTHDIAQLKQTMVSRIKKKETKTAGLEKVLQPVTDYIDALYAKIKTTDDKGRPVINIDFARYPFSVDGESHFYISDPENVVVDIEKLAEWFQQIRDSLDGLYYMYSDEWENA